MEAKAPPSLPPKEGRGRPRGRREGDAGAASSWGDENAGQGAGAPRGGEPQAAPPPPPVAAQENNDWDSPDAGSGNAGGFNGVSRRKQETRSVFDKGPDISRHDQAEKEFNLQGSTTELPAPREQEQADDSEELERQVAAPPQMRGLNMTYLQELDQATGLKLPKAPPTSTDLDLTLLSRVLGSAEQARRARTRLLCLSVRGGVRFVVAEADEVWDRTRLLQKIAVDMYSEKNAFEGKDGADKLGMSAAGGGGADSMGSGLFTRQAAPAGKLERSY